MDYIYPNFIVKLLRKPSQRTTMESSLVGITFMLLASLGTTIYLLFFVKVGWAYGTLIVSSAIGVMFFMGSLLVTSYIQYYMFKKTMGLYPPDERLDMKIEEAKQIREELDKAIKEIVEEALDKLGKDKVNEIIENHTKLEEVKHD